MKWLLVALILACTVASDVLQAREMKRHGQITSLRAGSMARRFLSVLGRPALLFSVLCLAISFFAFLRLLRMAPLSFAVPVTALTYVADALLAKCVLHEDLNRRRWLGIAMITGGVVLISL
jgi:drug/metabolite transporter (DMT)-like permease